MDFVLEKFHGAGRYETVKEFFNEDYDDVKKYINENIEVCSFTVFDKESNYTRCFPRHHDAYHYNLICLGEE